MWRDDDRQCFRQRTDLHTAYLSKGQAAKGRDEESCLLRCQVIYGMFQMHSDEGEAKDVPLIITVSRLSINDDSP